MIIVYTIFYLCYFNYVFYYILGGYFIKRVLTLVFVLIISFTSLSVSVFSQEKIELGIGFEQEIIAEALREFSPSNNGNNDFSSSFDIMKNSELSATSDGNVIQLISENNEGEIETYTLFPYKITENDELVNSFSYAKMIENDESHLITPNAETTTPITGSFIDVVLTIKTTFGRIDHNGYRFFRHGGIEFWWTSNNPTVAVLGLTIDYQTIGTPYRYPDILTDIEGAKISNNDYLHNTITVEYYPVKGRVYIDGSNPMPYDRVVTMYDYMNHRMGSYVDMIYRVDGEEMHHHTSFRVDNVPTDNNL